VLLLYASNQGVLTRFVVWSNFEIADMDFWRGEAYSAFFDHLDKTGGFYYEVRHFCLTYLRCGLIFCKRWGDAPVHSIAVGVLLPKQQIHWFNNIGYEHHPNTHCPSENDVWRKGRCTCNPNNRFGKHLSCLCLLSVVLMHSFPLL
jgi:alpha 1,2-mannosyltransferase